MTPTHATGHDDTEVLPGVVLHNESLVTVEHSAGDDGVETDDLDPVDADLLPSARRRIGKPTIALVIALVLGVGVLGGAYLDRHVGTTTTAATGFAGGAGRAAGFAGGEGFGGFGGGAGAGGAGGGAAGAGAAAAGTANPTSPAVIGTVVSWTSPTLVVRNLGGTTVTVTTTPTTTLTRAIGAADLAAGQTVSVVGTAGPDSTVTATAITVSS